MKNPCVLAWIFALRGLIEILLSAPSSPFISMASSNSFSFVKHNLKTDGCAIAINLLTHPYKIQVGISHHYFYWQHSIAKLQRFNLPVFWKALHACQFWFAAFTFGVYLILQFTDYESIRVFMQEHIQMTCIILNVFGRLYYNSHLLRTFSYI